MFAFAFFIAPVTSFAQFEGDDLGGGGSVKDGGGWSTDYYTSNDSPWVTDYYTSNETPWSTDYYTSNETPWTTDYYTSNETPWITDYYTSNSSPWTTDYYTSNGTGCTSCGGGYSTGGGYSSGGTQQRSGGSYQLTATPWSPVTVSSPRYPTTPSYSGGGSSSSYSSSNTSVTNTSITNIDNSIRDSFNNYNSNNVVVAEVKPATPQYPVVYVAPSCEIRQALASGSGVTSAYLSWTSTNATSATLSNVGSVATIGSQTVWPTRTTTYTLTVFGQNGQSTSCSVTVQANTYVPPVTPYVSLTQIPYTGFDFGPFGNAIYWTTLASFALALGYLAIYFKGGVMAFATARTPRMYAPVIAPKAPILVEREAISASVAPIVASMRKTGTTDSMAIVLSKDGSMPRIVIDRS